MANAVGDIAVRGPNGWTVVPAGTSGDVLTSNGAGTVPTYETPSGGPGGVGSVFVICW